MIENSRGQIKARDIAHEVCLGIKQFERTFSKYVGLNPKKFMQALSGFKNVIQTKSKHLKNLTMLQLAFDNGYYDQSHFIHDFKNLNGSYSPKAFFKEIKTIFYNFLDYPHLLFLH
jgi:AraC-like DNA-binding protein